MSRERATPLSELLDRVLAASEAWEAGIVAHGQMRDDPELRQAAGRIAEAMGEFYQLAGSRIACDGED